MKHLYYLFLIFLFPLTISAQDKYFARDGKIGFYSKGPIEDIEAHTDQASSIINLTDGKIVFSMLIKGFQFKKELMKEHFNENYLESDKYPKAVFDGMITNFSELGFSKNGDHELKVTGTLDIHGVKKEYSMPAKLSRNGDKLSGSCTFKVKVADHNIKIPTAVVDNIAEVVDVTVEINYQPYNK